MDGMKPAASSKLSLRFLSGHQIANSRAKLKEVIERRDGTHGHFNKLRPTHYSVDCVGKLSATPSKTRITGL